MSDEIIPTEQIIAVVSGIFLRRVYARVYLECNGATEKGLE